MVLSEPGLIGGLEGAGLCSLLSSCSTVGLAPTRRAMMMVVVVVMIVMMMVMMVALVWLRRTCVYECEILTCLDRSRPK